jgi:diketogulonate reductase-like aldo/keto reductase
MISNSPISGAQLRAARALLPIPGTTKLHRLDENIAAADVKLSGEDLREIDEAATHIEIEGGTLAPQLATWGADRDRSA